MRKTHKKQNRKLFAFHNLYFALLTTHDDIVMIQIKLSAKRGQQQNGAGSTPKGGPPMSVLEVIALLTLVLAAVSLGFQIKK